MHKGCLRKESERQHSGLKTVHGALSMHNGAARNRHLPALCSKKCDF